MKLDIILRTHDQSNVHTDRERYCGMDKTTLITGCLTSLVKAANMVDNVEIQFKILDDHSSEQLIQNIYSIFEKSKYPMEMYRMAEPGYNYSALKQFEFVRDSDADLVYSVEDDYLHYPTAIVEMLECHDLFTKKSGQEVVLFPFDMPDDYVPPWMAPCMVVHGSRRHWKTGVWTTNTFFLRPQVLRDHWEHFEKLAKQYSHTYEDGKEHIHEGNTICNVWKEHAVRFSPIPSIALHMQFDTQKDPYIPWEMWWEHFSKFDE